MRESRQLVPAGTGPAPARRDEAPVTPTAALLALQAAAGNRATVAALMRQPTLPPPAVDVLGPARAAMNMALADAIGAGTGMPMLLDELRQRIKADPALAAGGAELEKRVQSLTEVKGDVGMGRFDYVSGGVAIKDAISSDDALGGSFGPAMYASVASSYPGQYLAGALGDLDGEAMTTADLSFRLSQLLEELDDREALFQLELDGTLAKMVEVRGQLSDPQLGADSRKGLLWEISMLSRRALLLNDAAMKAQAEDSKKPTVLGEALRKVGPAISAISAQSMDEGKTTTALGDDTGLLTERSLGESGRFDPDAGGASVTPDEALPETTARSSDVMTGTVKDRVAAQQSAVSSLRDRVIPSGKSIQELKRAFDYLYAFVSPEGQRANPMAQHVLTLFEGFYDALGHAGIEGGFGRGMMMSTWEGAIANTLPQARPDFTYRGTSRTSYTRGKASAVDMRIAERYPSKEGGDDFAGEEASRHDYAARTIAEEHKKFAEADRMRSVGTNWSKVADQVGVGTTDVLVLLPEKERTGWSYLIRSEDPLSHQVIQEERSMPAEVADWILAENQRRATLRGSHHSGAIGEKAVRTGGGEAATGTVKQEYVEGTPPPAGATHPNLVPVKAAQEQLEKNRPAGTSAGQEASQVVIDELTKYLDSWFAGADTSVRITGVLAVANREHAIAADFSEKVSPEKLAWAVAEAVGMAAAMAVLARMGPIGKILSGAAHQMMKIAGASTPANVITAAGWFVAAGMADNLNSARAQAFMSKKFVDAIVSLITDALGNLGTAAGAASWQAIGRARQPTMAGDVPRAWAPVLEQPGMRKAFLDHVETEIKAREGGAGKADDPDLVVLKAIRDSMTGTVRPGQPHPDTVPLDPTAAKSATADPAAKPNDDPWAGPVNRPKDTEPILKSPGAKEKTVPPSKPGYEPGRVHYDIDEITALSLYARARADNPGMEVGLYYHQATDRWVVVHGEADQIGSDWRKDPDFAGRWMAVKHYHPAGEVDVMRLPSHEDFEHAFYNMPRGPNGELVKTTLYIDYVNAKGNLVHTQYGYDPKRGWFVDYFDPKTGKTTSREFKKNPWENPAYDEFLRSHGGSGAPPRLHPDVDDAAHTLHTPQPGSAAYKGIDPDSPPPGYTMKDKYDNGVDANNKPIPDADGTVTVRTEITGPKGEKGELSRSYNTKTGELKMLDSQLERLPDLVPAQGGPGMKDGGFPRWAYFSMRQMRLLGVAPSAPKHVVVSEVLHVKTLCQVAQLTKGGKTPDEIVSQTSMYYFAREQLAQAGSEIKAAKITGGHEDDTLGEVLKTWEGKYKGDELKAMQTAHNEILRQYGLTRNSKVLSNFNIELETVPLGSLAAGGSGSTSAPAPAPAGGAGPKP